MGLGGRAGRARAEERRALVRPRRSAFSRRSEPSAPLRCVPRGSRPKTRLRRSAGGLGCPVRGRGLASRWRRGLCGPGRPRLCGGRGSCRPVALGAALGAGPGNGRSSRGPFPAAHRRPRSSHVEKRPIGPCYWERFGSCRKGKEKPSERFLLSRDVAIE